MGLPTSELKSKLIEECRNAGVKVVFIKELPGTRVHGAVRWVGETPVIQLSCRYKVEDIFWFTFFHEAGHVVLHGKRDVFLKDDTRDGKKENEANVFASNHLIPETEWRRFVATRNFSQEGVTAFVKQIGIPSGIVVGRLQHKRGFTLRS